MTVTLAVPHRKELAVKNNSYLVFLLCCLTAACDSGDSAPSTQIPPEGTPAQESKAELEERYREAVKKVHAEEAVLKKLLNKRELLVTQIRNDPKEYELSKKAFLAKRKVDEVVEQGGKVPEDLLEEQERTRKEYDNHYHSKCRSA